MNKGQEEVIRKKIKDFFDELLFAYMEDVVNDKKLENDNNIISSAIKIGKLKYQNGVFKADRMSNKMALALEKIGAKYSKSAGGYKIAPSSVPMDIQQAVAELRIKNRDKLDKIQKYLDDLEITKEYIYQKLNFDNEVEKIGSDLDKQFKRSMSKIGVIPADLTSYQKAEIAKNYTYNLKYYIQKWSEKEIIELRKGVQEFVMDGYRAESIKDYIQKRKGISERKAKFLARQETKLLVAEYRKNRFKQEGVTRYRWSTVLDGRERELHKQLNGKIFSWDEPPIIDANTGEKGNPGEAYNCRCLAIPLIDDDFYKKK